MRFSLQKKKKLIPILFPSPLSSRKKKKFSPEFELIKREGKEFIGIGANIGRRRRGEETAGKLRVNIQSGYG